MKDPVNVLSLARGTPLVIFTHRRRYFITLRVVRATRRGRLYLYGVDERGVCRRAWASQVESVGARERGRLGAAWLTTR